jgi:LuxR family maltose regulon positive regulatory protein
MSKLQSVSTRSEDRLLHAKLMPPRLPAALIYRHDLLRRMDESLTKKLTLVTAPTGFGKTTLVSQWIDNRKIPSAWVTLDGNDNDPVRFWTYVITALRTLHATIGRTALAALMTPQPSALQSVLTSLINDLTRFSTESVLVLEDYHAITSAEINNTVSFLLQHLPASLHLILISRNEPDLPLGILRARDELIELDMGGLRFTAQETEAFLKQTLQTELQPQAINTLQERTEGWVAGLRLAALSIRNLSPVEIEKFTQTFTGNNRYVADYLIHEVFEHQPEAVQTFLLKTCFLNRLTGSLCDLLTGSTGATNADAMLEQLEREHLFIVQLQYGGERTWYRYHSLFAESIQHLARQRIDDEGVQSIYKKASDWYESQGMVDEAIEAALTARLFEPAMALIQKFIEIHDLTELYTLTRWMESIPSDLILAHPAISFAYAQALLYTTDRFAPATAARLEPFLEAAEIAWRAADNRQGIGEVLSTRGLMAFWQGDFPKAFEYARQSLEELPEHDIFYRGASLITLCYEALSAGRILEAQDMALETRALLGAARNIFGVLASIVILIEVFYLQGEMELAEQLCQQILAEADEAAGESMLDDQGMATLSLGNIAWSERSDSCRATHQAGA